MYPSQKHLSSKVWNRRQTGEAQRKEHIYKEKYNIRVAQLQALQGFDPPVEARVTVCLSQKMAEARLAMINCPSVWMSLWNVCAWILVTAYHPIQVVLLPQPSIPRTLFRIKLLFAINVKNCCKHAGGRCMCKILHLCRNLTDPGISTSVWMDISCTAKKITWCCCLDRWFILKGGLFSQWHRKRLVNDTRCSYPGIHKGLWKHLHA